MWQAQLQSLRSVTPSPRLHHTRQVLVNVRTLPEARFGWGVSRGQGVPRAFGKAVWGWPPGFAADAGAMQIQLGKGRGLRGAEAALRSMALHCHGQSCLEPKKRNEDGRCRGLRGNRCGGKVGECGTRRGTQSFSRWGEWFHAAAVNSGGERSWISAAVNLSMTFMGPPHLGQR